MLTVEVLADLLNAEIDDKCMDAVMELWNDGEEPFDAEHPDMAPTLEKITDKINEIMSFDNDYDEY